MNQNNAKPRLRVLITNNTLADRSGSELYVRDIAFALLKRGYYPIAYSSVLGAVAEELRRATIPVVDNLNDLNVEPDLIHAHHHLDAMATLLHFPKVPALYFCHGWLPWEEMPLVAPSIFRYIAVDDLCRERLLTTPRIAPKNIRMLFNFVDLKHFPPRSPLPHKPRSALIFSNYASERNYVNIIRSACQRFGIEHVDVAGIASGNPLIQPGQTLQKYDLVFAKARCALEAMAVGCAVIIADVPGLGGMVTIENVAELRQLNFGVRTMQAQLLTEENVYVEIARFDPDNAEKVSQWIRQEASLDDAIQTLEGYYEEILAEKSQLYHVSTEAWASAASHYLRTITPTVKQRAAVVQRAAYADELEQRINSVETSAATHTEILENRIRFLEESLPKFDSCIFIEEKILLMLPPLMLQNGASLSHIDNIEHHGEHIHISGWACDGRGGRGCSVILAVVDGKVVGTAAVNKSRPDVQQYLNLINEYVGFEMLLVSQPKNNIQLLAVTIHGKIFMLEDHQKRFQDHQYSLRQRFWKWITLKCIGL